jgi:site-specific DNA-methyltransferase (adenine-specific)
MTEWEIVQGDCLEVLATIEPGSVNLVFADPPYNTKVNYGAHYNDAKKRPEYLSWCKAWIVAAVKTLAPDGSMWVLINDESAAEFKIMLEGAGLHRRNWIVWYETFGVNCTKKFSRTKRHLFYMVRHPKRFTFNRDAVRIPSDRQIKYNDIRANPAGKLPGDVWKVSRIAGTFHERVKGVPTQVPLELLWRVIVCSSNPGDFVVDPFCGSGSTGVACLKLGRRFLGIELSADVAAIAREELASITLGPAPTEPVSLQPVVAALQPEQASAGALLIR